MTYIWSDAPGQTLPSIQKPSSKTTQDDLAFNVRPVFPDGNLRGPVSLAGVRQNRYGGIQYSTARAIRFKTFSGNPWWQK
ncbi:MAG: hypothetical protein VYE64_01860 [Planctomycetota bacterium]|nr:hypothetical protein [Planctomycetota bacterium]